MDTILSSEDAILQSPRKRVGTHAIMVRGGKYTFCYLPEKDIWKCLAQGNSDTKNPTTKMITFRNQWYYCGSGTWDKTERYDPVLDSWSFFNGFCLLGEEVVVRGQLYRISSSSDQVTISVYNVGVLSWQNIHSSQMEWRSGACVLSADNSIYVIGGSKRGSGAVSKVERFNTVHKKWEEVADMQQARCNAFGVASQGNIFVAGDGLSCEVYSISANEWQLIGDLNIPRYCRRMVGVNGTVYALNGSTYSHQVQSYDPTLNKWTTKTSIPVDKIPEEERKYLGFTGCALRLSKTVLKKVLGKDSIY